MARRGLTLTDPTTGQTITFVRTAADTGGELLELESTFKPGGQKPPAHRHPAQAERYEVISGELQVKVGRKAQTLGPGEVVEIPAGTAHSVHGDATVRWEVRPALGTEQFLEAVCDPHAPASSRIAAAWRHRAEFRLTGPAAFMLPVVGRLAARRTP